MKRSMLFAITLLLCTSVFAQMPPQPPMPPMGAMPGVPPTPPSPPMPPKEDPIGRELFPPELIMSHQDDLQLQDKQRATLRAEVVKLQTTVVDLQFQLGDEASRLAAMLRSTPIDEAKAIAQSDKVMALEREIKRLHLTTLIRIKNVLTADQIAKLREFRRY